MHPPWTRFGSSGVGLDAQSVVHGNPELLFASEVALRRLNRDVTEQELDLVQFAACELAETGTRASQVVRRQLVDAGTSRSGAHYVPQDLRRHPVAPDTAGLVDRAEHRAVRNGRLAYARPTIRPATDAANHEGAQCKERLTEGDRAQARNVAARGLLTAVRPPMLEEEVVSDWCRARDDAWEDRQRCRHRLG
jgi:hypothetical protein